MGDHVGECVVAGSRRCTDRLGDRHGDDRTSGERCEVDEPDPVGPPVHHVEADLDRQPRLAGTAGTEHRDQRPWGRCRCERRQFGDAVDHRRSRPHQVVAVGRPDAGWTIVVLEVGCGHLEQLDRLVEVADAVVAEVRDVDRGAAAQLDHVGRRQDLATVRRVDHRAAW